MRLHFSSQRPEIALHAAVLLQGLSLMQHLQSPSHSSGNPSSSSLQLAEQWPPKSLQSSVLSQGEALTQQVQSSSSSSSSSSSPSPHKPWRSSSSSSHFLEHLPLHFEHSVAAGQSPWGLSGTQQRQPPPTHNPSMGVSLRLQRSSQRPDMALQASVLLQGLAVTQHLQSSPHISGISSSSSLQLYEHLPPTSLQSSVRLQGKASKGQQTIPSGQDSCPEDSGQPPRGTHSPL